MPSTPCIARKPLQATKSVKAALPGSETDLARALDLLPHGRARAKDLYRIWRTAMLKFRPRFERPPLTMDRFYAKARTAQAH